jgi:hypothetical protein
MEALVIMVTDKEFDEFVRESLRKYPPRPARIFVDGPVHSEFGTAAPLQSSQDQRSVQTDSAFSDTQEHSTTPETTS